MSPDWKSWSVHVIEELKRLNSNHDKLDAKVDKLIIDATANTENLKEHMRRTEAAEKHNQLLEQALMDYKEETDQKLSGFQKFLDRFRFFFYLCGILGGLIGLLAKVGLLSFQPLF